MPSFEKRKSTGSGMVPVAADMMRRRQFALLAASVAFSGCSESATSSGAAGGSAGAVSGGAGPGAGAAAHAGSRANAAGDSAANGSAGEAPAGGASGGDASGGRGSASGSSGGGSSPVPPSGTKSKKRGIAYNELVDARDFGALSSGVSWWYNWGTDTGGASAASAREKYAMDFIPMVWGASFNDEAIVSRLTSDPDIHYLLVLNEPNLMGQAYVTPAAAAELWPRVEQIAHTTGVKIVGPQITWGNMVVNGTSYADPVAWLDAFYAAYEGANGKEPRIDCLGFHWYDYGLAAQLDRLTPYGKPFWVTEIANWHTGDGDAAIDSVEKQKRQMTEMIAICETRADVERYAWFTGRLGESDEDVHFTSLLAQAGNLTELGQHYLGLPFHDGSP